MTYNNSISPTMRPAVSLVIVTDDTDLAGQIQHYMQDGVEPSPEILVTSDPRKASAILAKAGLEGIAFYDVRGGDISQHNPLSAIPTISRNGPVICVVDSDVSEVAQAALSSGATDVLAVSDLSNSLLRRAVRYARARREAEHKLARLHLFDPVTSLPSQSLFWEILSLAIRRAKRNRDFFAILLINMENLPEGLSEEISRQDFALQKLAERITPILRGSDTIARFEQHQLAILADSMPRVDDIQIVAQKIIEELAKPLDFDFGRLSVKVAIGISLYPTSALSAEGLLSRATDAMLQARKHDQNFFIFA